MQPSRRHFSCQQTGPMKLCFRHPNRFGLAKTRKVNGPKNSLKEFKPDSSPTHFFFFFYVGK